MLRGANLSEDCTTGRKHAVHAEKWNLVSCQVKRDMNFIDIRSIPNQLILPPMLIYKLTEKLPHGTLRKLASEIVAGHRNGNQ